jgi:DNA end-binding protein Ku
MRAVWKGAVSFGLVTIPVKMYRATEERDVAFHQVRASDGSRIRYRRLAEADGEEVAYADIAKGYELPSGETVVLTDEDMAELPLTSSRTAEVEAFVPLEQVDPIYFDKSYYLEPDGKNALKPYALLRDALVESGRVALVKVALRQREQLATLRIRDGIFVLETMIWPDEVREADFSFVGEHIEVKPQELKMASSLIESLAADFDPTQYTDAYRGALESLIQAKIEGNDVRPPADVENDKPAEVVDLMSALRASVQAAKDARAAASDGKAAETEPASAEPAAKAPPKPAAKAAPKVATKKVSAKKTTAKKTVARKSA